MRRNKPIKTEAYRNIIYDMALAESPSLVVEVGVYLGQLSRKLALLPTLEKLILVDSWITPYMDFNQTHMDGIATQVFTWAEQTPKVGVMRLDSVRAVDFFADGEIDFWQTDGDHTHEGTYGDIMSWLPKVKSGSIMCGDNLEIPTVRTAITQAASELGCEWQEEGKGRIWLFRKP